MREREGGQTCGFTALAGTFIEKMKNTAKTLKHTYSVPFSFNLVAKMVYTDIFIVVGCWSFTSKVISGQLSTCDSAPPWLLYSAATLGKQAAGTMT